MKRQLKDISNHNGLDYSKTEARSPEVRRRRVEMEKRRRDKINYYLDELANLVPAAAQKRGCAKLEKAEVLELTLDHVRSVVKENKDEAPSPSQDRTICADKERRRGFLACLQHISQFLEKSESLLESNEKLIACLKDFLSGQTNDEDAQQSNQREKIYDTYVSQQDEACRSSSSVTYENIFYKICMDFLKNSSSSRAMVENANTPDKVIESHSFWQVTPEVPNLLSLSCDNFGSIDDLSPPYGSFMSLLNSDY